MSELKDRIQDVIDNEPVALFMKGLRGPSLVQPTDRPPRPRLFTEFAGSRRAPVNARSRGGGI